MSREAEIRFYVQLDEERVPDRIQWEASEASESGKKDCRAIMLSIWDGQERSTLSIDLWTREMTTAEMDLFVVQALKKLSDTYRKSNNNGEVADLMDQFAEEVAGKLKSAAEGPPSAS